MLSSILNYPGSILVITLNRVRPAGRPVGALLPGLDDEKEARSRQ